MKGSDPMSYILFEIKDDIDSLSVLADDALQDNYRFVRRTIAQWHSNENRFDKDNEFLLGIKVNNEVIAIGGLNIDPYLSNPDIGRIRHVYVHRNHRGKGLGKLLLKSILERGVDSFEYLRLSTNNEIAANLYESLGFIKEDGVKCTHILRK